MKVKKKMQTVFEEARIASRARHFVPRKLPLRASLAPRFKRSLQ
jgi:hypothetical protein